MTLWAWDIETEKWDRLIVACAVSEDGDVSVQRSYNDVRDWYRSLPKSDVVLAHNGGGFDFLCLLDACRGMGWSGRLAGSAIVSMRAEGGAECRDTYRLFPMGLAKWSGSKAGTGFDCECGKSCGGYCAFRVNMPEADMRKLIDYCVQDCRALLDAYQRDIETLEDLGLSVRGRKGNVRLTCGSVAWHTMVEMAGEPAKSLCDRYGWGRGWTEYDAGRRAYYGGRCEVGMVGRRSEDDGVEVSGHRYDVHAMYPWALTLPVPVGLGTTVTGAAAGRYYRQGWPGAYHARVVLPDNRTPLLPHRVRASHRTGRGRLHKGRLLWATGVVEGWWTLPELVAAECHGARIERVGHARIYAAQEPLFGGYVRHIYAARDRARASCVCNDERRGAAAKDGIHCCNGTRLAALLKWYANAPTGRLAMRPEQATLRVLTSDETPPDTWRWLGGTVYVSVARRVPLSANPIQAAYLTARPRAEKLLPRLLRHDGRWVYCDTDSTYLLDTDDDDVHPSQMGAFGYEGAMRRWFALAPKVYRYEDAGGRPHVRCKGVPRPTWETLDTLYEGGTVRREIGVESIRSSGGGFVRKSRSVTRRHGLDVAGTRAVLPDGTTVPLRRERDGTYRYPL